MVLVDSSVWIDYFKEEATSKTDVLDRLLAEGERTLVIGDLILLEVLQGFRQDRDFQRAQTLLGRLPCVRLGGKMLAVKAAQNYRRLRGRGITVRKPFDTLIATYCIEAGVDLLHDDRDFEPFVSHLGLKVLSGGGQAY